MHKKETKVFGAKQKGYEIEEYANIGEGGTSYLGVSLKPRATRTLIVILAGVFILFAGRASALQIMEGHDYRTLAEGNRIRLDIIPATRGQILDKHGTSLVNNIPLFVLAINPLEFPQDDPERVELIEELAKENITHIEITEAIDANKNEDVWIPIKQNLEHQDAVRLMVTYQDAPSVSVLTTQRREYATENSKSLSHILGFVGKLTKEEIEQNPGYSFGDSLGKIGLEAIYETELRGKPGRKHVEVDALGNEKEIIAKTDAEHGQYLITGLDLGLQEQAETVLAANLKAANKKRGIVVILDPQNGEVRALVSLPSFDSNEFSLGLEPERYSELINDEDKPLFNRAISGTYQSGSTIKPLIAAGALAEGIITPNTTILSTGGIQIYKWFFPDWRKGGHGPTNVYQAIANSVNTFFYYIGGGYGNFEGLGPDKLAAWAKRFGLGYPLGIDLPSEAGGLIPTRDWKERERNEVWYIGDTYHFAIGQGDVLVTPLQMAHATATIANGGTRYKPHIVTGFRNQSGDFAEVEVLSSKLDIVTEEQINVVRGGMRRVVTDGSARRLSLLPVSSAGKTGTAQWSRDGEPHAWFVAFAPFRNPEIAIVVLVEEGGEGGIIATPIAYEILRWWAVNR